MNKNIEQWGRYLIFTLVMLVLSAGCAAAPAAETAQETATVVVPTPDPLYTLHCIRQSGNIDLCYVSEELAADPERLEKVIRNFCQNKSEYLCSVNVWKDEASVAQTVPLEEAEAASRVASFSNIGFSGGECYRIYSNGEVVSSSVDCK